MVLTCAITLSLSFYMKSLDVRGPRLVEVCFVFLVCYYTYRGKRAALLCYYGFSIIMAIMGILSILVLTRKTYGGFQHIQTSVLFAYLIRAIYHIFASIVMLRTHIRLTS